MWESADSDSMIAYMGLSATTVRGLLAAHGALCAATVAAAWRQDGHVPLPPAVSLLGTATAVAGATLTAAGMSQFGSVRQLGSAELGDLVNSGAYRVSRNPQYAGYALLFGGLAAARRSGVAAVLAAGVAAGFRRWIAVEERYLHDKLGDSYRAYQSRTNRWVGLPI